MNLRREKNVFFVTSLFEIDCELEARNHEAGGPVDITTRETDEAFQQPDETELQWLGRILNTT